jgi:hypothetical protein
MGRSDLSGLYIFLERVNKQWTRPSGSIITGVQILDTPIGLPAFAFDVQKGFCLPKISLNII